MIALAVKTYYIVPAYVNTKFWLTSGRQQILNTRHCILFILINTHFVI